MEILVSLSKIKEQDVSAKVTVEAGKATKTKPAMAKIVVSTPSKKNAATITFKPTAEATIEKPKYEARLNRMGKGFRMKNAAECIQALKVFGFDPKDGKPIREFYSGKLTAAQFKKAMGTKSYQDKEDVKALDVIKKLNAANLPTSGKGKITRKSIDRLFADYQKFPIISAKDVDTFLKAVIAFNDGKFKPTMIKNIRTLFTRSNTNRRNPKVANMGKIFNTLIAFMERQAGATSSIGDLKSVVRKDEDGDPQAIFGRFEGRTCLRGIEIMPSMMRPIYYTVLNNDVGARLTPAKLKNEYKALGITAPMQELIQQYASEEITPQQFSRAFNAGKFGKAAESKTTTTAKKKLPKIVLARAARTALNRYTASARAKGRKMTKFHAAVNALAEGKATDQMILDAIVEQASGGVTYLDKVKSMGRFSPDIRKVFEQVAKRNTTKTATSKAPMKKPPTKKAVKDESAPASKVSGNVVTDGNLSVELPTDSRLTAAEANKIIGYFSKLLENKEVAKAQANRALKDLASGEMTPQMKKRWLARVGASEIRPVPRKLVTLLREEPASKPVTRLKARGQQAPAKKRKDTVRPMANSTPHAIAKAITKAGYKGTLAARQRGDLVEIYNVSDNSVVWSWNRKTFKAIDFTQERTNKMYSTLNLDGMKQTEKVDAVASILNDM